MVSFVECWSRRAWIWSMALSMVRLFSYSNQDLWSRPVVRVRVRVRVWVRVRVRVRVMIWVLVWVLIMVRNGDQVRVPVRVRVRVRIRVWLCPWYISSHTLTKTF
jgi:hypothetical protein